MGFAMGRVFYDLWRVAGVVADDGIAARDDPLDAGDNGLLAASIHQYDLQSCGMSKSFHDYYFGLSGKQRDNYVQRVDTSVHYAERVAGGFALPSLRKAMRFVRASGGKTSLAAIVAEYERRNGPI